MHLAAAYWPQARSQLFSVFRVNFRLALLYNIPALASLPLSYILNLSHYQFLIRPLRTIRPPFPPSFQLVVSNEIYLDKYVPNVTLCLQLWPWALLSLLSVSPWLPQCWALLALALPALLQVLSSIPLTIEAASKPLEPIGSIAPGVQAGIGNVAAGSSMFAAA